MDDVEILDTGDIEEDINELKDALEEDIMELKDDLEEEDIMELKNDLEEALPPLKIVEETVIEDLSVPEIIAQEVIIKDGSITTIGAGPYNGFIQSPTAVRVPAFIAAIREDGEILSKSIIPIPLPASGDIPVPTAVSNGIRHEKNVLGDKINCTAGFVKCSPRFPPATLPCAMLPKA